MHVRARAYATSAPTDRHSGTSETESASTRHSSLEKGVGALKLHSSPPRNRFAAAVTLAKPVGAGLYDAPISRHCATSNDESASTMHSVYLERAGGRCEAGRNAARLPQAFPTPDEPPLEYVLWVRTLCDWAGRLCAT